MTTLLLRALIAALALVLLAPSARADDDEDEEGPTIVEPTSATTLEEYQRLMQAQILPLLTPEPSDERFRACRALPYNARYRATLAKVAAESPAEKLRRHAERAVEALDDAAGGE